MGYQFEWDPHKARANQDEHGVAFDEASTVFGDPLSLNLTDPDHSLSEDRFLVLGLSAHTGCWSSPTWIGRRQPVSSARVPRHEANGESMKKAQPKIPEDSSGDKDTMRAEYDFSSATRGATARRYSERSNVVVLDPEVARAFPNDKAVNDALRSLIRIAKAATAGDAEEKTQP